MKNREMRSRNEKWKSNTYCSNVYDMHNWIMDYIRMWGMCIRMWKLRREDYGMRGKSMSTRMH